MDMNIPNVQKVIEELSRIDSQINQIELLAKRASSENCKTTMSLKMIKPEEGEKVKFDEDGSIQTGGVIYFSSMLFGSTQPKPPDTDDLSIDIDEVLVLGILGQCLERLRGRREEIVRAFNKLRL